MDAPAMAFAKPTVGHNGTKACGKCEVVGVKIGRMCFPNISNKKRTDREFRLRVDKKHHKDPVASGLQNEDLHTEDNDNIENEENEASHVHSQNLGYSFVEVIDDPGNSSALYGNENISYTTHFRQHQESI